MATIVNGTMPTTGIDRKDFLEMCANMSNTGLEQMIDRIEAVIEATDCQEEKKRKIFLEMILEQRDGTAWS